MKKLILQVFENTRQLLSDPTKWTKGEFARDENNKKAFNFSKEACQFCVLGGLQYEANKLDNTRMLEIDVKDYLYAKIKYSITDANDYNWRHDDLLKFLDEHIATLKKECDDEAKDEKSSPQKEAQGSEGGCIVSGV